MGKRVVLGYAVGLLAMTLAMGWVVPQSVATAADAAAQTAVPVQKSTPPDGKTAAQGAEQQKGVILDQLCRIKGEGQNVFTADGKLTLVLRDGCANYRVAQAVTERINGPQLVYQNSGTLLAKARDHANIEVALPSQYRVDPVAFISQVLCLQMVGSEFQEMIDRSKTMTNETAACPKPANTAETTLKDICRVKGEGENIYTIDGKITLALHEQFASYQMAAVVVDKLSGLSRILHLGGDSAAKALDRSHIELAVPAAYREDPVAFIAKVLSLPMDTPKAESPVAQTVYY